MKRTLVVALLTLGLAVAGTPTRAALIALSADQLGYNCKVLPGGAGLVTVYVVLRQNTGTTGLAFSAPIPPDAGFTYLADQSAFIYIGTSQTGIQYGLGSCIPGDVVVGQILLLRTASSSACVPYRLLAHPDFASPIVANCAFVLQPALGQGVMLNADGGCIGAVPPSSPVPNNGAAGVSTMPTLSWEETEWICEDPPVLLSAVGSTTLYLGTTPEPPAISTGASSPYAITTQLLPQTTYYWRVNSQTVLGPLWSFTTAGPLQTVPTTWGRVKAIFR